MFKNDWRLVKRFVKTRSLKQIQKHAEKYLMKLIKKYFENKEDYKKFDLDLKLTDEEIKILVEKKEYDEGEQGIAELYILCNFKKKSKNYEIQKAYENRNKEIIGIIEDNNYDKSIIENTENNSNNNGINDNNSYIFNIEKIETLNKLLDSKDINDLFKLISYNSETNKSRESDLKLLNRYREIALKYNKKGILNLIDVGEIYEKEEDMKRLERINKKKEKMMETIYNNENNNINNFYKNINNNIKKNKNKNKDERDEEDEFDEDEINNLIKLENNINRENEKILRRSKEENFINIEDDEDNNKKEVMNIDEDDDSDDIKEEVILLE